MPSVFEDQGVLGGCVCRENFQRPWMGQGPTSFLMGVLNQEDTPAISRDEQVLAQRYFN